MWYSRNDIDLILDELLSRNMTDVSLSIDIHTIKQEFDRIEKTQTNKIFYSFNPYSFKSIKILELSSRAYNALTRGIVLKDYLENGYTNYDIGKDGEKLLLSEVIALDIKTIKGFHGMGPKSFKEIVDKIHSLGLKFEGETK